MSATADTPDLRLVLPAVAAWGVAWLAGGLRAAASLTAAVVLALLGAVALRCWGLRGAAVVAAVCVCAAAAAAATGLRVASRTGSPVALLAGQRAAVTVVAVLLDDPRVVAARGPRPQDVVVVRVRVERLEHAGRPVSLRQPLLVLTTERAWLTLLPSQRVRVAGRLEPARPRDDVAAVLSARGPPVPLGGPSRVQRLAGRLRAGLRSAAAPQPRDEAGLLPGLVVGDTSRLPASLTDDFRTTGLTHLTAVSGTNVAIVLAAVLLVSRRIRLGPRAAPVVSAVALGLFVVLARPSPSVLRAAVMGVVGLVALATGGRRRALPSLAAAVLLLVLADPDLAGSPGFALSVLATGGLLLLGPPWRARLAGRLPGWAADAVAVPAAAQLACGPVIVALSGQLGLLSVPANLLAAPAVAPATVLGVLAALLAPVSLPAAKALAWLAWPAVAWLVLVARTGARLPGAALGWPSGTRGALLLVALSCLLLAALARRRLRTALLVAVVAGSSVVGSSAILLPAWPVPGWFLVMCDVGQGDALVLSTAAGSAVVVDAGPDPARVDRCLTDLHVHQVPLVLITHDHADHVEGLPGVLRGRHVGQIELGPLDEPAGELGRVEGWARRAGVPLVRAALGEVRVLGSLRWQVLAPLRSYTGTNSDPNNSSLVLRLTDGPVTVLLTGDVEPDAQQDLLARLDLRADVLKVPHHGSAHQRPELFAAVHPAIALTSVGADNTYGHPSPATLARIVAQGAQSYRTDQDGDVAVALRGGSLVSAGRHGNPASQGPHLTARTARTASGDAPRAVLWALVAPVPVAPGRGLVAVDRASSSQPLPVPDPRSRSPPVPPTGPVHRTPRCLTWDHARVPRPDVLAPLTVVIGDEPLLVDRAVTATVRAAREAWPTVDVHDRTAAEVAPGDLLGLLSPSLFDDRSVLIVRGAQDLGKDVAAELIAAVRDAPDDVTVVVTHAGGAKGKALLATLLGAGARKVDAPRMTRPSDRRDFVRNELRGEGRQVTDGAVTLLLDAVGADLRELCSAASQLVADTDGPITDEVVGRYFRGRADLTGFAVADRALEGDLAGALELTRWGQSTGLAPVLVTSALASTLRSVALVMSAGGAPAGTVAAQLGMPPWKVDKTRRQGRGWRPDGLSVALRAVALADADVKGAAVDQDFAVERVLLTVVAARSGGR